MVLRLNKKWMEEKGVSLELITPEDMSLKRTGVTIKDSIIRGMLDCDIVITLFSRKVAKLLEDEFKLAYENFRKGNKPHFMFVYFKSASVPIEEIDDELLKVGKLKKKIQGYKDIYGIFNSEEDLIPKIQQRLEAAIFHEHKAPLLNLPISLKRLTLHNIKCFQDGELSFW